MSENIKAKRGVMGVFKGANASTVTILLIFVLLCVILSIAQPAFLEPNNLLSTARAFSAYAIAGLGVSMVIMTGGIDISVGAIYGLAATIAALSIKGGVPTELALILGMLTGVCCGLFNGSLVVFCKLPPMIATLGTQQIFRGICYITTRGYPISGLGEKFLWLGQGYFLGVRKRIAVGVRLERV